VRNGAGMKSFMVALAALGLMVGGAQAATPSAEQRADFYKTCMGIAEDEPLCTCKADAALTLIDADFMAMVISSMKGKAPPTEQNSAYNVYVAKSNQICKPNY
jgi:hypothetical protein